MPWMKDAVRLMQIVLPDEIHGHLKAIAKAEKRSMVKQVAMYVETAVNAHPLTAERRKEKEERE